MRILYLNHTGAVSGAERSLLELVTHLPPGVEGVIGSPSGPLHPAATERGVAVHELSGTDASLRTSAAQAPGVALEMTRSGREAARVARLIGADLIHANSIRAGLIAVIAARLGGPPAIVHLRDTLPPGPITTATLTALSYGAAAIIGNSEYTTAAFARATGRHRGVHAIPNPVDLERFSPQLVGREAAREALDLSPTTFAIGVVGQITPWKGQDTAIRAVAAVREQMPEVKLLVVGEAKFVGDRTRHDNAAYLESLHRLVAEHGLEDTVKLLGERDDIPALMRALDLLLVPSWEEPFGRVVVEGMAMGAPVLATAVGGPAEIITDGVDGVLLPPDRPDEWAEAITRLAARPDVLQDLAAGGRRRAQDFGVEHHVGAVVACYEEVLAREAGVRRLARRLVGARPPRGGAA